MIAIGVDPGHFNPAITTAAQVHAVADSIFNGLVALDEHGNPRPDLAVSWDVEDEGRTYVFHLVEDAVWHDGERVTSEDVVFTFENVLLRYHSRTRAGLAAALGAIEAPDPTTVVFRFREPYGPLLRRLDVTEAPILPEHVYRGEDIEHHPANLAPVGSGPYRLASYRRDDTIELERNERYFKPGLPRLDRLVFRVIPDANTQVLALEQGEVDYVSSLRPSDAETLRRAGDFTVVSTTSGPGGGNCVLSWIFNLERPALSDIRVRRALARAIDRDAMVEKILFGEGRVAAAPISSAIGWAHAVGVLEPYSHDAAAAGALLDEAGYSRDETGRRLALDIVHFPSFLKYGELMQQQLGAVGVELSIRALDRASTVEAIYVRRDFDTGIVSYCNGADPDIGVRRMYDSASVGPVPFSNGAAYRNADVDDLLRRAASSADVAIRGSLYRAVQERVASDLPYFWLVETHGLTAYRARFTDFEPWSGQFAERASLEPSPP